MDTYTAPAVPAWIVRAWAPVLWQTDGGPPQDFVHLGTQVISTGDGLHRCSGQTLWGRHADGGRDAGVAWDWVELPQGVVAMADPLAVVSNLRIVGPQGEELSGFEATLRLNELVHALPWQNEVQRALKFAA
jgi:hypothetical protein